MHIVLHVILKRDGETPKEVPLIGNGFLAYIDHLFWFLPFPSTKEAYEMMAKREIPDDHWALKRQEIADEHLLERAPQDLRDGWKAWLKENGPGKSGANVGQEAVPANGPVSKCRRE